MFMLGHECLYVAMDSPAYPRWYMSVALISECVLGASTMDNRHGSSMYRLHLLGVCRNK